MPRKKLRFILNYFVGPVLFIILAISIYRQIQQQQDLHQKWAVIRQSLTGSHAWMLYVTIALTLANWGTEAKKWQLLLQHLQRISFLRSFISVLSGVAFTMITPNRMGEFIGRVFYVKEGRRIQAATLTIVGSLSQLIITLTTGIIGMAILHSQLTNTVDLPGLSLYWVNGLLFGTIAALVILLTFYFKISWLARVAERLSMLQKYRFYIAQLDHFKVQELLYILLLSLFRFSVFTAQYLLLFSLFDVQMLVWQGCCAVSIMFLILAVIPMPGIAELGIRGKASVALFMLFSTNGLGILATTGCIWLINIILPAVLGSLFMLNVKLFGKNGVKAA